MQVWGGVRFAVLGNLFSDKVFMLRTHTHSMRQYFESYSSIYLLALEHSDPSKIISFHF